MALDINASTFTKEVIEKSKDIPVLVDFWAEWCGPCKTLGPILEALETQYNGKFRLAKVDTEANTELANSYQIRSIPACKIFVNGQVVDEFVGALPDKQIKEFLDKYVSNELLTEIESLIVKGKYDEAESKISEMEASVNLDGIIYQLLQSLGSTSELTLAKAEVLLKLMLPIGSGFSDRRNSLLKLIEEKSEVANSTLLALCNPQSAEAHLISLLDEFEENGDKGILKLRILAGLNVEIENPSINQFRKRFSRLLH
jgi:thioredoxin